MVNIKFDPRTKLILFFIVNFAVFSYMPYWIIGIYVFICFGLLLLCKKYKNVVLYIILFIIFRLILYIDLNYQSFMLTPMRTVSNLFILFFPFFVYGRYIILTTRISEFSLALEKIKIPLGVQIALLVMFRFFPTIKVEAKSISNAMKLKGLSFTPFSLIKHPIRTVEYIYVPLIYSLIKTGDELTVASLTRGLGLYKKRTYLCEIGFHFVDIFMIIIFVLILVLGFYFKGGVVL